MSKKHSVAKTAVFILITIFVVGVVCISAYAYSLLNDPDFITLGVGESYTLPTRSDNYTVRSYDASVITPTTSSTVSASALGEAVVCVKYTYFDRDFYRFKVIDAPDKVTLNDTEITLVVKDTATISAKSKSNEREFDVSYSSCDPSVATVSEQGEITALKVGECDIICSTYNGVSAKCKVTVTTPPTLLILDKYLRGTDISLHNALHSDVIKQIESVTVSDDKVLKINKDDPLTIHCKSNGKATITVTLKNSVSAQKTVKVADYKDHHIDFDILNQFPELATGCEVVSLTSVLNHYGFDISKTTMAEKYMPMMQYDYYSVSPHDYFLGTPYSFKSGMGCFSGCIVKTAHNYFDDKNIKNYTAVDITGCSVDELFTYLENDIPVITWVTSNFVTPTVDGSWYVGDELIKWCNHEHCLVTTGYNKNNSTVTVGDDTGGYSYTVSIDKFTRVFEGMGSMAVVVLKH